MRLKSPYLIRPHDTVKLSHLETADDGGYKSQEAAALALGKHRESLAHLQEILYAGQQHSVLIVLQGMDTAGKDGTIAHIFSGINPQGCNVAQFRVPTPLEARHDFLWRCHEQVPAKGMIGIFNRSHYEDVLSPRVHKGISAKEAERRMDEINAFEQILIANGTLVLKFFLHISHEEQTSRLLSRLNDPKKHWKLSEADFKERKFWSDYQHAYDDILSKTSRKHAPWFVIPADKKWFRNLAISGILVDALKSLKLDYPAPTVDASKIKL